MMRWQENGIPIPYRQKKKIDCGRICEDTGQIRREKAWKLFFRFQAFCLFHTLYFILSISYSLFHTLYFILFIPHSSFHTLYFILFIPYSSFHTPPLYRLLIVNLILLRDRRHSVLHIHYRDRTIDWYLPLPEIRRFRIFPDMVQKCCHSRAMGR